MNLQQIHDAIQARGYSFTEAADDATNPILILLNGCYRNVNGLARWPWLQKLATASTVAGTAYYSIATIASDQRQLDSVRLSDGQGNYDLAYLEPQAFEQLAVTMTDRSLPRYWGIVRGQIGLLPVPDAVYTMAVDYIYQPPDLAAVSDIPVIPPTYHDVLVWGTIAELSFRERDYWDSNLAQGNYQMQLKAMQEEYLLRQVQTSSRVKRSGFYDRMDSLPIGWGLGN